MKKMTMIRLPRILLPILISVVLIAPWLGSYVTAQDQQPTVYEYKTTQVPTPTPVPSSEGKIALRYIADKYGIPDEKLAIVNEHIREYAALGKTYKAFSILELINYRFFDLLIDSNDLSVTEDIASIQRAEDGAHRDKYGKLEPALYKRIQEAPENEMIEVAILVAGKPRRNLEELFTELAAMFPEAEAALELSGKPFDVEDPEVRKEIEHAYHAMRKEDTGLLIRPVVEFLHSQGYVVTH